MEYYDEFKLWANKLVLLIVLFVFTVPLTIYILVHWLVQWWVVDLFDSQDHEPLVERTAQLVTLVIMAILTFAVARTLYANI